MFVFLSKFLPSFVYPLGLVFLLVLVSVFVLRRIKLSRALLIIAVVLLFLGSNRWVATSLTRSIEQEYLPPAEIPQGDVIVVLGGGTEADSYPRTMVEINGAGDRVLAGAKLYRDQAAPYVLLSGGDITWLSTRPSTPATEMRDLMEFFGVPEKALILQSRSQNTHEDAVYSAELIRQYGFKRVILVTSALHMPRSVALFKAQGIDVIPYPVDYAVPDYTWQDLWHEDLASQIINILPNAGSLSMTTTSLKELLGMLVYHLQGWL